MTSMSLPLNRGLKVIFDEADFGVIEQYKWTATAEKGRSTVYVQTCLGDRKFVLMHRMLVGAEPGQMVDHRNGNGLDNRRANLRIATNAQNQMNRRKRVGSSQYKGVCWDKTHRLWMAYITVNKKRTTLGYSKDELEAAIMYDEAAKKNFGEFAQINGVAA